MSNYSVVYNYDMERIGMKIGYARVSTKDQKLDRQMDMLEAEKCDKIYCEKISGKSMKNRPEFDKVLNELKPGDILILAEWDRATRSMFDGIDIIKRVCSVGAVVKVLDKPHLDLSTPIGQGFLAFLSALAQDERERIAKRAGAGRKAAKERGVKFGPKNKLHPEIVDSLLKSGLSKVEISRRLNVGLSTVFRTIKRI